MSENFSGYFMDVTYAYVNALDWRYGQTCFNVLFSIEPELANSIRGTELDPFHDDKRVPEFLAWLRDQWDD